MVKIAFWDNCLNERGTTVSVFNYAYFNKTILGNESIIMYNTTRPDNRQDVIEMFKKYFTVIGVNNFKLVDQVMLKTKCDIFYIIKAGDNEGQVSKVDNSIVMPSDSATSLVTSFRKNMKFHTKKVLSISEGNLN